MPAAATRNIFTVTQSGTMTAFTTANVATLATFMNTTEAQATRIIDYVRALPLGPFVGSTPAFMDPPSIEPAAGRGLSRVQDDQRRAPDA